MKPSRAASCRGPTREQGNCYRTSSYTATMSQRGSSISCLIMGAIEDTSLSDSLMNKAFKSRLVLLRRKTAGQLPQKNHHRPRRCPRRAVQDRTSRTYLATGSIVILDQKLLEALESRPVFRRNKKVVQAAIEYQYLPQRRLTGAVQDRAWSRSASRNWTESWLIC